MAAFVHHANRPLKRPRLGAPDVYPQEAKQKEDELTATNVKQGFIFNNLPTCQDEYGTARTSHINPNKFGACFSTMVAEKQKVNTFQDSGKKKIQISKDNYWLVTQTTKSKAAIQAWFQDLAGSKPLQYLAKRVPQFNKKDEIFVTLYDYGVPMIRATWFLKMTAAYSAAMSETKMKKRAPNDPSQDWCQLLNKFLRDQLAKIIEYHHTLAATQSAALSGALPGLGPLPAAQSSLPPEIEHALNLWQYNCKLVRYLYQEGMLECHEFLSWLVDITEKVRPHDDNTFRIVLPFCLQFLEEFVKSQMLSRRLAYMCVRRLTAMCNDATCAAAQPAPSPHMVTSPSSVTMPTSQPTQQQPLAAIFAEYTSCPQHRPIIVGLSLILQTITLRCPSALVWINIGEGKSAGSPGSPLDILPCAPSSLPLPGPPTMQNHHIRASIRNAEHQIKMRSRAAEVRWSSDKCQESTTESKMSAPCYYGNTPEITMYNLRGHTISRVLHVLELLDRHCFDRCDSCNCLDSLYNKIFNAPQNKDGSELPMSDDPIILLLCEWAVCSERNGEHRALVVAQLLEKRVIDLESEQKVDSEEKESMSTVSLLPGATPLFQGLLTHFLDTQAPVFVDESISSEDRRAFANLVLLFSELIRCDVFSHDAYMCTLISRGDLTTSPPPLVSEPPPSSERMDIDPEKRTPSEIKEEPKDMDDIEIKQEPEEKDSDDDSDDETKPSGIQKKESVSFQEKFLEAIQSNKLTAERDFFDDEKEDRKKGFRESSTPSPHQSKPNRHLMYAMHFPIPQDEMSAHECNQRLVLLYGFGKARDEARHTVKRIQRETLRALGSKKETPGKSDSKTKHIKTEGQQPVNLEQVVERYRTLSYFDQHMVTAACASHVLEQIQSCSQGSLENLPLVEQITLVFELMESALNIHGLLDFSVQLLNYMSIVEMELTQKSSPLAGNYTPNLCLSIVAVLRRYQACLLVSQEQTATVFELLCGVVKHVTNVTVCSSAERCILAYLYDLYTSCSHLKAKFSDMFSSVASKVKQTLYTSIHPSESNLMWNPKFMQEYILNSRGRQFHHSPLGKQLNESPTDRYSFVCNVLLSICCPTDAQMLNDLSIMCAELTSCCSALSSEWLGVLKALCCSSNPSCGFNDILCQVDVNDLSIHDSVAVFAAILIARHCFALEDVVEHVALTSLLVATPSLTAGTQMESDAEPGARLMCRLLLRLLSTGPLPGQSDRNGYFVKSSCDQHLLAAAHRSISVEALVGVLKAILLLGEASVGGGSSGNYDDFTDDPKSSGSIETASLSDYAKFTLKTICSQSWVREIFLKDPDRLWTQEVLLDQVLSHKQAHYLVQLICYPSGVSTVTDSNYENEQKHAITRILRNLDQWTLRVSWLELQLMLKQCANSEMNSLLDNIAKATIEVFQQQQGDDGSTSKGALIGQNGQRKSLQQHKSELERCGIWLVAPLISKLSSQVQGRVLRAAGNVLESVGQTWSKSSKDKDKQKTQMSLVSHQPLLSLVLTCLKGQDEQREGLLTSLQTQLTQFLQSPKDDRWEDEQSRRMMHEALQLRLSLVGNMFDTILRSQQWTTEFALLLLQLITTGTVDTHSNSELFTTVLDMLSVLINSTLSGDCSEGEKGREHQTLIKKLKKELGDKHSYDIDRVRQLLPVPKKTCDVVTVEPMGSLIDTKGNKIAGFDSIDKKQGLQVASKQKINPWDTLEAFKNPAPLSWSFFGAVRMERKPLKYQEQFRLTHYHTHTREKPDDYYFQPPQLPPDEEEPPQPISHNEVEKVTMESGNSLSESSKGDGSSGGQGETTINTTTSKKRKRAPRKKTPTPSQQIREPFAFNTGIGAGGGFQERPFMQQPQNYMQGQFPYQQPLPPAGPSRIDRQMTMGNSKAALRNMLVDRKHPGTQGHGQTQPYHLMQKRQQMAQAQAHYKQQQQQQAARGNVQDMFMPPFKGPHDGPMHHMPPGAPQQQIPTSASYGGYNSQMMPQAPLPNDAMVSPNYSSHYSSHGAQPVGPGGMMGPQMGRPQSAQNQPAGYMSQRRQVPAVSRLQHQLQQRASMQHGVPPGNIMPHQPGAQITGTQPYMQQINSQQQQQDRQRQLLQQQRLAAMQKHQGGQHQQPQHQQQPQHHQQDHETANLVSHLKSQMTRGGPPGSMAPQPLQPPPPQYNVYQQQY
ncbi:mediator of RNA polymerase II transcription subunit 12-like protein isoform X2 [Asterias rubens]|uniref:mediator of RNA polymerase II transcription subunit 12-like protein isoform X2 n=1 Tax=Asterias rubens TaxID=7604 RepID=UPI0014554DA1|nr:mediator of RNA polymerase II transcription subunit 12-like protein isoform X2 [Asterias rubens]